MAKKANKKKIGKKKAKAPEAEDDELKAQGASADDGLDADEELDAEDEDQDEEEDADEEEEDEDDAPPPAKKAADDGESFASKGRKKEAARAKQGQPAVLETWYEWKRGNTYNEKKGLKLVEYRRTKNGAQSTYVGWEKKIPKSFLKKLRTDGLLKE